MPGVDDWLGGQRNGGCKDLWWGRARTVRDVCDGVEEFGDVGRDEVVLGFNCSFS